MRASLPAVVIAAVALAACTQGERPASNPRLDALFVQLQSAPNAMQAATIEDEIWSIWQDSGSPTVDVLVDRAEIAESDGDVERAREFLAEAARIAPRHAEIWNRSAALSFGAEEHGRAIREINETVEREPRHFGALAGLGAIYESLGEERAALEAYRAALAVHPFYEAAQQGEARLAPKLDGRDT